MKWSGITTFLIGHAVATGAYLALFLALPLLLGGILFVLLLIVSVITGDPGGPMFLPGFFIIGSLYSLGILAFGVVLFLVTGLIQLLRCHIKITVWTPIALAILIDVDAVDYSLSGGDIALRLGISAAFLVYWMTLTGSFAVLTLIRSAKATD